MSLSNIVDFWRRTPVGVFPICLGLIGAGLLWRRAAETLGAPAAIGEIWLALAVALYVVCSGFYALKLARKPDAILDDLRPVPARAAVSAASMSTMLTAAFLAPYAPGLASAVWWVGVLHHGAHAAIVLWVIAQAKRGERPINPTLYLPFVGQIVAPIAGVPLGWVELSLALYWSAAAAWVVITVFSLWTIMREPIPKQLRQGMVIFLAPSGVGVISAEVLDASWSGAAMAVFGVAVAGFAGWLATRIGWLVEGGWTPAWGAFTFPTVALAGAAMVGVDRIGGGAAVGWALLFACSAVVLRVFWGALESAAAGRRYS